MLCRCTFTVPSEMDSRSAIDAVSQSLSDHPHDLDLAGRQRAGRLARRARAIEDGAERARHRLGFEPLLALVHAPHAIDQRLGRRLLEDQPPCAPESNRLHHLVVGHGGGQEHGAALELLRRDRAQHVETAALRHPQIEHEHEVLVLPWE